MEESRMRNTKVIDFMGSAVLLSLAVCVPAAALEIQGTLQDVNGKSLSGTITVIQETPNLIFTHHEVDDTGRVRIYGQPPRGNCCCMRGPRNTPRPST